MKTIEIVISPTGQTRIETKGFTGATCREASQFLEAALGQRTGEQRTAEFYRNTSQQSESSRLAQGR